MYMFKPKYSVTFLVAIGYISHAINYYFLHNVTLISRYWTWLLLGVSTLIGLFYLVRAFELHKDNSYQGVKGMKLQLTKMLIILLMGGFSFMAFGGYLYSIALGANHLFRHQETQVASYEVLDVTRYQSHRKSRKERLQISLTDGRITNVFQVHAHLLPDFNYETDDFKLETRVGLLGWKVIESVDVR